MFGLMSKELFYQLATLKLGNHLATQQMSEEVTGHYYLNETKHDVLGQGLSILFDDKKTKLVHNDLAKEYMRKYRKLLQQKFNEATHAATIRILHLSPQAGIFPFSTNKEQIELLPKFLQLIVRTYWDATNPKSLQHLKVESAERLFNKGYYLEAARVYFNTGIVLLDTALQLTKNPSLLEKFQETYKGKIQLNLLTPYERQTESGDIIILDANRNEYRKYYVITEKDNGEAGFIVFREINIKENQHD